jgi:hypothetical protein
MEPPWWHDAPATAFVVVGEGIQGPAAVPLRHLSVHRSSGLDERQWALLRGWSVVAFDDDLVVLAPPSPVPSGGVAVVESTYEFRAAIEEDRAVVLPRVDIERTLREEHDLFGALSSSRLGGSIALLALSGAGDRQLDLVDLRSPAALGLRVDRSPLALASLTSAGRLHVDARGLSGQPVGLEFIEAEVESDVELEDFTAGYASDYAVALRILASVDPSILIPPGAVFQQTSLNGVQTLATAAPYTATLGAGGMRRVILPASCMNRTLSGPSGQPVQPTGLVAPFAGLESGQESVWAGMAALLEWSK